MTTGNVRNVAASVRAKLLNIANREGSEFGLVLTRFALERLLYRLSESTYRDQFILKGALLFQAWTQKAHRPTRDLDLLGNGNPSAEHCEKAFREICDISVADDGLVFFPETVRIEEIKEEQEYEGVRVKFLARLENARIQLQVDIGFGDAVTPSVLHYPRLLSMPAPRIQAYPMETVRATFARRRTQLDSDSLANLLAELSDDTSKRTQWRAFLLKSNLAAPDDFAVVNSSIREFLLWPMDAAGSANEAPASWLPGGPWSYNLPRTTFAET